MTHAGTARIQSRMLFIVRRELIKRIPTHLIDSALRLRRCQSSDLPISALPGQSTATRSHHRLLPRQRIYLSLSSFFIRGKRY